MCKCKSWPNCQGCNLFNFSDRAKPEYKIKLAPTPTAKEIEEMYKNALLYGDRKVFEDQMVLSYITADVHATNQLYQWAKHNISPFADTPAMPKIKDVIFNGPATIVLWEDGVKTVVKTQDGEQFDPEKGLAMAISKRVLGNKRDYYYTFRHFNKKYEKSRKTFDSFADNVSVLQQAAGKATASFDKAVEQIKNFAKRGIAHDQT